MYIDKETIYLSNGKQSCGNTLVLPVTFSPKLPDYFIQEVIKKYSTLSIITSFSHHRPIPVPPFNYMI